MPFAVADHGGHVLILNTRDRIAVSGAGHILHKADPGQLALRPVFIDLVVEGEGVFLADFQQALLFGILAFLAVVENQHDAVPADIRSAEEESALAGPGGALFRGAFDVTVGPELRIVDAALPLFAVVIVEIVERGFARFEAVVGDDVVLRIADELRDIQRSVGSEATSPPPRVFAVTR